MGRLLCFLLIVLVEYCEVCAAVSCPSPCPSSFICAVTDNFRNITGCVRDPCTPEVNRCNGKGRCSTIFLDEGATFNCQCHAGYGGQDCSSFSSTNGCFNNPCRNSGVCLPINEHEYNCICDGTGHFGRHCEVEDPCAKNPCINGVCELVTIGNLVVSSRKCRCRPGFTGENCETDINECLDSPCQNGMLCENLAGSYLCHCSEHFTGIDCSVPIKNMCHPETCLNGGNCRTTLQGPICDCRSGWSGEFCQFDVDECRTRSCQNGGTCLDHSNGTSCLCLPGWSGPNCELDINECSLNNNLCKNNGDCINVNGSYYCVCPIGYGGADCSNVLNMCDRKANMSCLNGGVCKSEIGYYRCECTPEWQGTFCEHRNPCASNPCTNGGSCVQLFDNPERHRCYCPPGFTGLNCESDINECEMEPCGNRLGVRCENTIGSFNCHCPDGLSGQFCSETMVFNCSAFQPCSNGGTCVGKLGGYECICPNGFDGNNCEQNINECEPNPCRNSGTCLDLVGNFQCLCASSFTGPRCESTIDECATTRDFCYHGGSCVTHTDRSGRTQSKCHGVPGYIGPRCEADINECASKPCDPIGTSSCANLVGDFKCLCYPGYSGIRCENKPIDQAPRNQSKLCAEKCLSKFGNGHCDIDCNTYECRFDGGDCNVNFAESVCPIGCNNVFANGQCDPVCNIKPCLWDGNDCFLNPLDPSKYIHGVEAKYLMSCDEFYNQQTSSVLLFNISQTAGVVTREDSELDAVNDKSGFCIVNLMFDSERCIKDSGCPKNVEEFIALIGKNPAPGLPDALVDNSGSFSNKSSEQNILIGSIIGSVGFICGALILAFVLSRKRVRAKTWFPPGFFEVLRLTDQNTNHIPNKQRKTSSNSSNSSVVTSVSPINGSSSQTSTGYPGGYAQQPGPSTYLDPNLNFGPPTMTPPDRRELDLIDPPGPDGLTPLMLACTSSHLSNPPQRVAEIVQQLILRGANPLAKTCQREETALHLAARYRNAVALRILLDFCPDPNMRDADGKTPLHSAVGADAQDCMRVSWFINHFLSSFLHHNHHFHAYCCQL